MPVGGRPALGENPEIGPVALSLGYLPETVEKRRRGLVELAFFLLFSKQGDKLLKICGDGVPRTTARAGLMTPTAQADAAVGSIRCEM